MLKDENREVKMSSWRISSEILWKPSENFQLRPHPWHQLMLTSTRTDEDFKYMVHKPIIQNQIAKTNEDYRVLN